MLKFRVYRRVEYTFGKKNYDFFPQWLECKTEKGTWEESEAARTRSLSRPSV